MRTFLWVTVPYLCLTTLVVGHFWRYCCDKFGRTTRFTDESCVGCVPECPRAVRT
jgi:nitrate reductase gamma subunit